MQKNWTQVQKKLSLPAQRLTNKHVLQRLLNQSFLAWTLCFINYPSQKQKIITAAIRSSFNECLISGLALNEEIEKANKRSDRSEFGWVSSGRSDWSWKNSITLLVKENLFICAVDVCVKCYPQLSCVYFAAPCLFSFPGVWNWQCQAKLPKTSKTTKWTKENCSPPNICRLTTCCFLQTSFTNAHKDRYLILHLYSVVGYLSFLTFMRLQ